MEHYSWQLTTIAISLSVVAVGMVAVLAGTILLVFQTRKVVEHMDRLVVQADYIMTRLRLWTVEFEDRAKHAGIYVDAMNWNLKNGMKLLAVALAAFKAVGSVLSAFGGEKGGKKK